jgi:hypothetical protein
MGSTGLVTLKEIEAMLADCAPGAVIQPKTHKNWFYGTARSGGIFPGASTAIGRIRRSR